MYGSLYQDSLHYDAKYDRLVDDILFFHGQALRYGSPVLELAVGTGRIAIPLARAGVEIVGLDLSGPMLARAREKARQEGVSLELVPADCRDFDLGRRFHLVTFPFNSIAHLHTAADLAACFGCVKKHLSPGGAFILDMFNPDPEKLTDMVEEEMVIEYEDPDGRGRVRVYERSSYNPDARIKRVWWRHVFSGRDGELCHELVQRIYFPGELDCALEEAGFAVTEKYGDYDKRPFSPGDPKQILVAKVRD